MTMPLRIAFVAPFGLGQKSTVWARTLPLARVLVAHGHVVTILIPPWDTPADSDRRWVDEGVEVVNVSTRGGVPATLYRLFIHLERMQPDIIHVVKPRAHAGLAQWWHWQRRRWLQHSRSKRPAILLDVDDWEQSWAVINRYPWLVARFLAWQEEWGLRHADGITAASHWLVTRVGRYSPQTPVLYLPNGIAQPAPQPISRAADADAPTVLLFTRLTEVEPEWLAAFWQHLHAQIPSARFYIGGQALDIRHEEEYRARFNAAQVGTTGVEWLGYVHPDALPDLYARTTCAIFPAANDSLNQAKCSVKLATTLLYGVPVVASAVGEQANYGANGAAHLVPGGAPPAAFATAVATVIQHPDAQSALAKRARQHLQERYSWKLLGAKLNDFYCRFARPLDGR